MSQSIRLTGQITQIFAPVAGVSSSGKEWCKQEYVMRMDENGFSRHVCFTVFGKERIEQFNISIGDTLSVSLNVDAREFKGKWYNSIECWRIERIGYNNNTPATSATSANAQNAATSPSEQQPLNGDDNIPF